jgi:glucose-6-phosphate 1-dehydrogenase
MTDPFVFVVFGASGDLSQRKLIPSLFKSFKKKIYTVPFKILAVGRRDIDALIFRAIVKQALLEKNYDNEEIDEFVLKIDYFNMNLMQSINYGSLKQFLDITYDFHNYIYYFAISSNLYCPVAKKLSQANLTTQEDGFKRVIVEKPFGHDLESAIELNNELHNFFNENQIFRIDHYLGKETVQNILVTRFANSIFEPLWNRNYIDFVEITSAESLSVGSRVGYYDSAGALRDMVKNHLLQVLALIAMEAPINTSSKALRDEMVKVFQSLRPIKKEDVSKYVVRGQYIKAKYKGEEVIGYREENGVSEDSKTETYVAMKCFIDNWRWSDIPFYIKTGKSLATNVTEAVIHFKANPHSIFKNNEEISSEHNQLVIRIQPDAGFLVTFQMKVPGAGFQVQPVKMDFHYASLQQKDIPEAYERLIYDCVVNDPTLYQRSDAIELTWNYVQPIIDAWAQYSSIPLYGYPARSWGPQYIENILSEKNHHWRFPCANLSDGRYCEL